MTAAVHLFAPRPPAGIVRLDRAAGFRLPEAAPEQTPRSCHSPSSHPPDPAAASHRPAGSPDGGDAARTGRRAPRVAAVAVIDYVTGDTIAAGPLDMVGRWMRDAGYRWIAGSRGLFVRDTASPT